ncbi:MAG TPA: thiamine-phosphate kinase [Chthoniobacterales bacterium]|jgi:thiamine-monophosphate kinase
MKLAGYGENRLIAEMLEGLSHLHKEVIVGPGDDCAVIAQRGSKWDQLLKTDTIVEGIHFEPAAPAADVGWKALCRAISDVAAMGGESQFALITLGLNAELSVAWVKKLYAGIRRAADHFDVQIVGGETVRTTGPTFVTASLTGRVEHERAVLRSTAQAGDAVLVTGKLGGSIRGWHLKFRPRVAEGRWLGQSGKVSAMMDLSDGIGADLPRLARASGLGYRLFDKAIPIKRGSTLAGALNDGEDYELLFTTSPSELPDLLRKWAVNFPSLPLSVIGELIDEEEEIAPLPGGFHHF